MPSKFNSILVVCTLFFAHMVADAHEEIGLACAKSGCYTKASALARAKVAVQDEGNALSNYEPPKIQLKNNIWTIKFVGKQKIPGNYCVVFIDNKLGKVTFMHGE